MAGGALVGLSYVTSLSAFYFFYAFNALGYVFGGPLPNQVLLSRWFDKARGKAMGIAYLGIGVGGALVPLLAFALTQASGLAGRASHPRVPDDRDRAAGGVLRPRAVAERGHRGVIGVAAVAHADPDAAGVLLPDAWEHGVDRRRRRNDPESRALPEPRSQAPAGRDRHDAVHHPRRQRHRSPDDGVAGRSVGQEARHVPDLRDRGSFDPDAGVRADDRRRSRSARSSSGLASAATT